IMATLRNTAIGDLQGGLLLIFVAIAIVNWVGMARLVRGQVLALKEREFVEAARAIGAPARRIMTRHLFPNILAPVIVSVAFGIPSAMLAEATLSFFGIGIKPPTASSAPSTAAPATSSRARPSASWVSPDAASP